VINIICESQIPQWFNEDRYLAIKNSTLKEIKSELNNRANILKSIESYENYSPNIWIVECKQLAKEKNDKVELKRIEALERSRKERLQNSAIEEFEWLVNGVISEFMRGFRQDYEEEDLDVNAVTADQIAQAAQDIQHDHIQGVSDKTWITHSYEHQKCFYAEIDLGNATDDEIVEQLRRLLPAIRAELKVDEPQRYPSFKQFNDLFACGVFEYLDLTMWARVNNYEIKPSFLSKVICNERFTAKDLSKGGKVVKHANRAMSHEYQEQLSQEIRNKKAIKRSR